MTDERLAELEALAKEHPWVSEPRHHIAAREAILELIEELRWVQARERKFHAALTTIFLAIDHVEELAYA